MLRLDRVGFLLIAIVISARGVGWRRAASLIPQADGPAQSVPSVDGWPTLPRT